MARGEMPRKHLDLATSMVMGVILQPIDTRLIGRRIQERVADLAKDMTEASYRILEC